jgi:hypothetical protein
MEIKVSRSDLGEGRYANYAEIGHNGSEFIFDFGQLWADGESGSMHVRVVTSPRTAEFVRAALDAAIKDYRASYGSITHEPKKETLLSS